MRERYQRSVVALRTTEPEIDLSFPQYQNGQAYQRQWLYALCWKCLYRSVVFLYFHIPSIHPVNGKPEIHIQYEIGRVATVFLLSSPIHFHP
ncbi:hypothetical protein D3C81_1806930 [compost metagenome]